MKIIVIGPSLSGKTTLVRYFRANTKLSVAEIDEELTKLNNGVFPEDNTYKHQVLAPLVIETVLKAESILFFTNTDYFLLKDLEHARSKGFRIINLAIDLDELLKRNKKRVKEEKYDDLSMWLKDMMEYQNTISRAGLVDLSVDAHLPSEELAEEIINFYYDN